MIPAANTYTTYLEFCLLMGEAVAEAGYELCQSDMFLFSSCKGL